MRMHRAAQEPHYSPVHAGVVPYMRLPNFLNAPDVVVYPLLTVQGARLPGTATLRWGR